ncbi:unnamed protein product [Rhizoctonia solani]|uniref:UvrD-like helicase C-terminal domain-containing protein n=1 Tax=Rhizoctonia solani TaxID=456999 RepID=A0A8H3HPT8_9AGAM|nr:unnamed protein product [Rhizoctonia solani]
METETGRSTGALPVIFTDASSDIFLFEQFLLKSSPSSNTMFGAQQAILVRSEAVADELNSSLSELCPVITIADSKGLEFEDILIYNFFSTSDLPLDAWDFVHGQPIKAHRSKRELAPPPSLCNDLKLLYVALTRARKRCWIWDHGYVVDAMKYFWLAQNLVTTASISQMTGWNTVASTPTQWIEKGREYFANGSYKLARGCFLRGGHKSEANIAEAYHEMTRAKLEAARHSPISDNSKLKLHAAAEKLKICAEVSDERNSRHLWFHAGTCLELALKVNGASRAYVRAGLYERAIRLLLDNQRYARAVPILEEHADKLDSDVREDMLDQCRVHYIRASDYNSLRPLFKDVDKLLAFTIDRGYQSQYTTFLEHNQQFYQLAQVYQRQNSPLKAIGYFLKEFGHRGQTSVLNEAAQFVIARAEWVLALDRSRDQIATTNLHEMMRMIQPFTSRLTSRRQKELALAQAILGNSLQLRMADDWKAEKADDQLWRARILHSALKDKTWLNDPFETHIMRYLSAWFDYASILASIIEATQPSRLASAQRLLGFKRPSTESLLGSKLVVAEWSVVAVAAQRHNVPTQRNQYGELLVSSSWVDRLVKSELIRPLKKQLFEIYSGLKVSRWISPIRFTPRPVPTNISRHVTRATTSDGKFATRVKFVVAAIHAFSPTRRIPCRGSSMNSALLARWVRRLFDILYPVNGTMEESNFISAQVDYPFVESVQSCVRELVIPSPLRISMSAGSSVPVGNTDFSSFVIGYSLALHLPGGLSLLEADGAPEVARTLGTFFDWRNVDGLTAGISMLRKIFTLEDSLLDAVAMVHFIEMLTCDMIYHCRKGFSYSEDGFSGLILPFSWARSLAKRYNGTGIDRDTECLDELLSLINMLSNLLKDKETQRWFIGRESLSDRLDMVHILNLRLCWCIALLIVNSRQSSTFEFADMAVQVLTVSAQDWWLNKPKPLFCRFSTVMDQSSCLETLCETLHHETLVRLSNGWENVHYWQKRPEILVIRYGSSVDLAGSLQRAIQKS